MGVKWGRFPARISVDERVLVDIEGQWWREDEKALRDEEKPDETQALFAANDGVWGGRRWDGDGLDRLSWFGTANVV